MTHLLEITDKDLNIVNQFLTHADNPLINQLQDLVKEFGGADAINEKARQARKPQKIIQRLEAINSPYLADIEWLTQQRDTKAFVPMEEYCQKAGAKGPVDNSRAVTLEISAMQFFPWLIAQARQAIAKRQLMPGRIIRVRNMAEQAQDQGDLDATILAMETMGATWVESLDTRGTDGSNIHLAGGPETLTGFFGGIGQPNGHPLKWAREYLEYYTNHGIRQVLNINQGTILLGYMLHRLGVDMEFKISVFVGNDNPFFILWTLMTARLFARPDGSTPLVGFNLANSVDN